MRKSLSTALVPLSRQALFLAFLTVVALPILVLAGCRGGASDRAEYVYVTMTEAGLRDHVATVYSKTGVVHNGDRLLVLERLQTKRFVRVRSPRGEEGWIQERYLTDQETYDEFQHLAEQFKDAPAQATANAETLANLHVLPGRKTEHLYQLTEKQKVDLIQRQTIDRNAPPLRLKDEKQKDKEADTDNSDEEQPKAKENAGPPSVMEDWWLVRDAQKHAGWVLGKSLYLDVPEEIAQYSEGQRIVAAFPLDEVQDGEKKVPEYLTLFTENKDGMPYDFNQARVFTWNIRRHRYETAYRERDLKGVLPVTLGRQNFEKEGSLRTFTLRVQDEGGTREKLYKFNPPIVRRVLAAGEEPPKSRKRNSSRASR